jgi:hypothetical protein
MKAIIYAGIGLFSAASVYGVVDYYNSKNNGTLDKMYKEEAPTVIMEKEIKPDSETAAVTPALIKKEEVPVKAVVTKINKKKVKKPKVFIRDFEFSNFSRGRILPSKVKEEVKTEPIKAEVKQ